MLQSISTLFTSDTRLYSLTWKDDNGPDLAVECWWGREALSGGFEYVIDLLSTDAFIPDDDLIGRALTLTTTLADGGQHKRSGYVRCVITLGADGGFARYRLTVVPWLWLTTRGRHHRVFQEKTVMHIVETVLADYAQVAAWQWSEEVDAFMADTRPRSYCVQYNEDDLSFIARLLVEEGLGWRVEANDEAPGGHRVIIFADSRSLPEDQLSAASGGIRFHRADSQEEQDSVIAFGQHLRLTGGLTTFLAYDYKAKKTVVGSVPTTQAFAGPHARRLEYYDDAGPYAFASAAEAERYARLAMEACEARAWTWLGRGTVRTLSAGTRLALVGLPNDPESAQQAPVAYTMTAVTHVGINNLTAASRQHLAERLQARPLTGFFRELGEDDLPDVVSAGELPAADLLNLALERGYANSFDALLGETPWRPQLVDDTGARLNPRPTAPGPMSAIVVGPNGETTANGTDEIWCDKIGRIKIRYHWQQGVARDDQDSTWVRVIQRQAGAGMGWQLLPRIGQEVLVNFLAGDIDRPYVLGALYNGRGEGGVAATPGGNPGETDTGVFDPATDHRPSGQGNLAGGHSPAWHGAAAESHRHADALSGFKSKEFGGSGFNQLVMDDADNQQRLQLKSTQHASELNLGHLIHQADNYRGSFRGTGGELRTDAWGALRAGRGLIMSTWPNASPGAPAGDMAPAMALLKQADTLAGTLSQAAGTHQTVKLAVAIGSLGVGKSTIDDKAAPLKALHIVASGMVDGADETQAVADAGEKNISTGNTKLPHLTDPALIQAARADFATIAGQNLQFANGECTTFASGQDSNFAIAGKTRIHTGQAIGLVAGAIEPGDGNCGISLIAAKDDVDLQAQSDEMKFQAKQELKLVSVSANIDFAAAKKIHLAVEGGASITIDGGITVQCPGVITVHASKKSFSGPVRMGYELPKMPANALDSTNWALDLTLQDIPGANGIPLAFSDWEILVMDQGQIVEKMICSGQTNAQGKVDLGSAEQEVIETYSSRPNDVWIKTGASLRRLNVSFESEHWTDDRRAAEALGALDYSVDSHLGLGGEQVAVDEGVSRVDTGKSIYSLWNEFNKN